MNYRDSDTKFKGLRLVAYSGHLPEIHSATIIKVQILLR